MLISLTKLVPLLTFHEPMFWSKADANRNMPAYNRNRCEDYCNENRKMTMMMIVRKMMMYVVCHLQATSSHECSIIIYFGFVHS